MLRLREIRKRHRIPLRELATVLGKSISQVQRYEIEENPITVDDLAKIARYLRLPLTDLIVVPAPDDQAEEVRAHG